MKLVIVFAIAIAGCRGAAQDAPCGVAAGRLFTIAKDELAATTVDDATRRAIADQLPAMRDALDQACTKGEWSATVRNCIANAPDHVAIQTCEQQLSEAQRHQLDLAARGAAQ
jgi:hypothetical protein